jgi:hypothetical protein
MPVTDNFKSHTTGLEAPITDAIEITPSDSTDLPHMTRALYIGSAGDARVTLASGTIVNFANLTVGWHPVRVARVHTTGTTAADITGCW